MVIAEAPITGQTGYERAALGPALSAYPGRRNCLSQDQTAGNILPMLFTHRDECDEDCCVGGRVSQVCKDAAMWMSYEAVKNEQTSDTTIVEEL